MYYKREREYPPPPMPQNLCGSQRTTFGQMEVLGIKLGVGGEAQAWQQALLFAESPYCPPKITQELSHSLPDETHPSVSIPGSTSTHPPEASVANSIIAAWLIPWPSPIPRECTQTKPNTDVCKRCLAVPIVLMADCFFPLTLCH